MGKKSPPPAPDYASIAREQSAASVALNNQQTVANRPNVNTPWGSQTWQQNGDQWTQNVLLSPQQQAALDSQMAVQTGRSQLAERMLGQMGATPSQGYNAQTGAPTPSKGGSSQGAPTPAKGRPQQQGGYNQPMDYSGAPQRGDSVNAGAQSQLPQWQGTPHSGIAGGGGVVGGFAQSPELAQGIQWAGPLANQVQNAGQMQSQLANAGPMQSQLARSAPVPQESGIGGVSAGSGSSGPLKYEMDNTAGDWRQKAQDAALKFQQPLQQQRQNALENQLANMGMTRGSEAWNAEMMRNQDQNTRDSYQAFDQGRQESAQLFNQDLQSGQFTNNARAQQFDQSYKNAGLNLQGQIANQAGQIANANYGLNAQGQQFNQNLAAGNFANNAQNQQFGQNLSAGQFANNAQNQQFGQNAQQAALQNQAQAQRFGQNAQQSAFRNQAAGQQFSQDMSRAGFQNAAQAQNFGQNTQQAAFGNQAAQQNFGNLFSLAQYGDQQAQQALNQQIQAGNYNNQNRQQYIAEQQMRRNQPLNELNALLTGQQVQNPNMPTFNTAGKGETPQMLNAANMGYQAQMDAFNARQQGLGGMFSGLAGLGGAAMGAGGWGGLFSLAGSEREYKDDITRVGTHPKLSIGIYSYRYRPEYAKKWGTGWRTGVMADELRHAMPEAISKDADGHTVVDYMKVFQ